MNAIGLEVSTSAAKCILYSSTEGVVASETIPFDEQTSNTVSQDPGRMVAAALEALMRVTRATSREVCAIGLGGTWHSLLLLDRRLEPLGAIRTWADVSGAASLAPIKNDREATGRFYRKTGCMVHAMYPIWKMHHLRQVDRGRMKEAALVTTQIGQLFAALTGTRAVSKCIASGSGLFNIERLDWDSELLDFIGLEPGQLENLVEAFHTAPLLPAIAEPAGLTSGIPVTVGCADGAMNQLATGGVSQDIMSFSVGTSGAIRLVRDEPVIPAEPSTWCYYLFDGKRLAGAATQGATNCLEWFRKAALGPDKPDYAALNHAASTIQYEDAPFFLPFVFGERCPGWNESRLGGFAGLSPGHQGAHFYYAVLEGILFNLYQCYEILTAVGGSPKEIRISGGILNSPFWLQMAADIFGVGISTTGFAQDSAIGAALTALKAVGAIERFDDCLPKVREVYEPRPESHRMYRVRYQRYLDYYRG